MAESFVAGSQQNAFSGAPTNGWTRKDRPCDSCRRRKSRCIIPQGLESCIICQSRAEQCTFVQNPQRRKRRRVDTDGNSPDTSKAPGAREKSPEVDRHSSTNPPLSDYDSVPGSLLRQTLGLQNRQHGHYLGMTSEYDTRLINLSPFNGRGEHINQPGTLRRVSPKVHFIMKAEDQQQIDDELANLDLVESIIQPHGRALVDLYFRIIHPSFPIMHKKVFLEKYSRGHREFTPPLLAAVYIIASNWWSYSPELVNLPKPDVEKLEKLVIKMMCDVLNRPKLSTVQAGLLLLQRPDGDSWSLTGWLIALSQNLGLHLDCSKWKIPEWERSLRKRLAWAMYMQDKWGALIHGRPSLINREDWGVRPVETRDFPETAEDDDDEEGSLEIENGRLIFIHMILLTEILTDILDTFYTVRAISSLENESGDMMTAILERAKPLQLRLKDWHAKLPQCLAVGQTKARKLSSNGSLHLAYFAVEVTLHRAILQLDPSSIDEVLKGIIRAAARMRFTSAIDLINKLEPAHLQSFWYFASTVNLAIVGAFGSLLWATSDNPTETEFYKSQLAEYRWTLRVSSKAAEFMKFTVGMLDASAVFQKDTTSNKSTPNTSAREPLTQPEKYPLEDNAEFEEDGDGDAHIDYSSQYYTPQNKTFTSNTASPGVGQSAEMQFKYNEQNLTRPSIPVKHNTRPNWSLPVGVPGSTNNWSLAGMYSFNALSAVEDVLGNRRAVQEYDERGNQFGGY